MNAILFTLLLFTPVVWLSVRLARRHRFPARRRIESTLESLETRIAPAALTAKFSSGVLSLVGDPSSADVSIVSSAASIEVFDGTASLGVFDNVKSIKANIQGGAAITANLSASSLPGSLAMTATGTTTLSLATGSRIDGALKFNGDAAVQTLVLGDGVLLGKALTYNGGGGDDVFNIGAGATIGGNATFIAVEDGRFTTTSLTTINGGLVFKNAGTSLPVDIQSNGASGLNVAGKVSYLGGTGNDLLFLAGTFSRDISFRDSSGNNNLGVGGGSTIRGSVTVLTGGGNDALGFQGGTIEGDVILRLGDGNNIFSYGIASSVSVGGNLSMAGGSGKDEWRTFGGSMTLTGNLSLKLGDGPNLIAAIALMSGDRLTITTGSGVDSIALDGTAATAAVKISMGAGNDSVAGTLLRANGSATFDGGDGSDHFLENQLTTDPLVIISFEEFN